MIKISQKTYTTDSNFQDYFSVYENNAAFKGGVFYFNNIQASFTESSFINSNALYGGAIYA